MGRFRERRDEPFPAPSPELDELADAWIALQKAPKQERDTLFWAFEKLDALIDHDPETAWRVIDLIWRRDQSDFMLAHLAAGPVEDLLVRHGPAFIERVYETARKEPVFRKLLGAVWRNSIAEPVWQRLKEIAGPSF
jgi:hypothetical protein